VSAERPEPLDPELEAKMRRLLELLAEERASVSSVIEPQRAWNIHVLDSLSGLAFPQLAEARQVADLGAGAGFPGLALALAVPEMHVSLVESIGRKCEFMRRAIADVGIPNAQVVCARSEELARGEGREAYAAVTCRAVGRLVEVAELASPLLRNGGALVVWKGRRADEEEAELEGAAAEVAMGLEEVLAVEPFQGSGRRHLYLVRKTAPTPEGLPRRPGMARKRPLGGRPRRGRG
jgi:16S rRNA (guanine527-N7)-methyltransferase